TLILRVCRNDGANPGVFLASAFSASESGANRKTTLPVCTSPEALTLHQWPCHGVSVFVQPPRATGGQLETQYSMPRAAALGTRPESVKLTSTRRTFLGSSHSTPGLPSQEVTRPKGTRLTSVPGRGTSAATSWYELSTSQPRNKRAIALVLFLTSLFLVVSLAGGRRSGQRCGISV